MRLKKVILIYLNSFLCYWHWANGLRSISTWILGFFWDRRFSWKSNSTDILSATMAPFNTGPSINRNFLFTKRVFAVPKSLSYIFPILNLSKPESLNSGSRTLFSDRSHLLTMKLPSLNRIWKVSACRQKQIIRLIAIMQLLNPNNTIKIDIRSEKRAWANNSLLFCRCRQNQWSVQCVRSNCIICFLDNTLIHSFLTFNNY